MRRTLRVVLAAVPALAWAAGAFANVTLNSFETAADFIAWERRVPTGEAANACPFDPFCSSAGPCVTLFQTSAAASPGGGTNGAAAYLQSDAGGLDCASKSCDPPFRQVTLTNFGGNNDWSAGYLSVAIDVKEVDGDDPFDFGLRFQDGTGYTGIVDSTLHPGGGWQTITVNIQDLINNGFAVNNMAAVALVFGNFPPANCTTVFVDNLRLISGTPPCAPVSVSAVATGISGQLRITWAAGCTGSNPIASYILYRATFAFTNPLLPSVQAVPGVTSAYLDNGLVNGTAYHYKIVAVDSTGVDGPPGDAGQDDFAVPTCGPQTPGIAAGGWTNAVRVIWSTVPGAISYQVYKGNGSLTCGTKGAVYYSGSATNFWFDDVNVTVGQTYCYLVTAYDGACYSPCSTVSCALFNGTGAAPCLPPGPILTFSIASNSASATLSWDQPAAGDTPISRYFIYRALSPGVAPVLGNLITIVYDTGLPSYAWMNGNLSSMQQYCYLIKAETQTGCTNWSAEQCITTSCYLNPPTSVAATGYCDRVRLSWTGSSATQFNIYRSNAVSTCPGLASPANLVATLPTGSVYYDDLPLTNGNTYFYAMTSLSPLCESTCSNVAAVTFNTADPCPPAPPCTPPGAVPAPTATEGPYRVSLTWFPAPAGGTPVSTYIVWQGTTPTGSLTGKSQVGTVYSASGATDFTYTATGLALGQSYCFIVEALDSSVPSCTNFSPEACFMTHCVDPQPPSPVSISAVPPSGILLQWDRATPGELPVTAYQIIRTTAVGGPSSVRGTVWENGVAVSFTFTDNGAVLNEPYAGYPSYLIRVIDQAGCTNYAGPVGWTCVPASTPSPLAVTALAIGNALQLSWTPSTPGNTAVTAYQVLRGTTTSFLGSSVIATVWNAAATGYMDTPLNLTVPWSYEVLPVDGAACLAVPAGPAGYSLVPPQPPAPLSVTTMAGFSSTLFLNWGVAVPGGTPVSAYAVWRSSYPGWPKSLAGTTTATGGADFTLYLAQGWFYQVAAVDATTASAYSAEAAYTCTPPGVPGPIFTTALTGTSIGLQWTGTAAGGTNVAVYNLFRSSVSGANAPKFLAGVTGTVYVDADPKLNLSQYYYYTLAAVSEAGCTTWSAEYAYGPVGPTWNAPITSSPFSASIDVYWQKAMPGGLPISHYVVFRSTVGCGPAFFGTYSDTGTIYATSATGYVFSDANLTPASRYWYDLAAVDAGGSSAYASAGPFGCLATGTLGACSISVNATALPSSVILTWQSSSSPGATGNIQVWRGSSSTGGTGGKNLIATLPLGSVSYTDAGLAPGTGYCYAVLISTNPPCSATAESCAGTPGFTAYPNPAKLSRGPVRFDGLSAGATVELYTINGELIAKHVAESGGLWLWNGRNDEGSNVANGIYLYLVRGLDGSRLKGKLVVTW